LKSQSPAVVRLRHQVYTLDALAADVASARRRIHIRMASVADPMGDLRKEWQAQRMRIEEWWPKLDPATQEWLIANNGDVVPTTVLGQIAEAGGDVTSDASSIGDNGPGGFLLSDAAIDWIEETANQETDSHS
jgi:hypothetical protein